MSWGTPEKGLLHYGPRVLDTRFNTACGANVKGWRITRYRQQVNCSACAKTTAYVRHEYDEDRGDE